MANKYEKKETKLNYINPIKIKKKPFCICNEHDKFLN